MTNNQVIKVLQNNTEPKGNGPVGLLTWIFRSCKIDPGVLVRVSARPHIYGFAHILFFNFYLTNILIKRLSPCAANPCSHDPAFFQIAHAISLKHCLHNKSNLTRAFIRSKSSFINNKDTIETWKCTPYSR